MAVGTNRMAIDAQKETKKGVEVSEVKQTSTTIK